MTDKEILEEVYRRVVVIARNGDANVPSQVRFKEFRDFIESEWQKRDELGPLDSPTPTINGQMYKLSEEDVGLYLEKAKHSLDAKDIERHVGLEIGDDGTVKEIK